MTQKTAIIIGAGPAGLTAALELLRRTDIKPIVVEGADGVGGISRTFVHDGNRIDLGGHRFFSKSDRVMDWWQEILPVDTRDLETDIDKLTIQYQNQKRDIQTNSRKDGASEDNVMLVRNRVSRIFFKGAFFDYPLSLNLGTIRKLGYATTILAGFSYLKARLLPRKPESTLEDFIINRFGRHLYGAFFEDYTEKVWGVACRDIPADWGKQRIKGLSITRLLKHAIKKLFGGLDGGLSQKDTETSLIERFLYPKYGPGHMWEQVAAEVIRQGGEVRFNTWVTGLETTARSVSHVLTKDAIDGAVSTIPADYVFSTMAIKELVDGLQPQAPENVATVAKGLPYRDFMTVGLLARKLSLQGGIKADQLSKALPDNWIYVQEPGMKVGRIQVFNNWSPFMVKDPDTVWIGLEYFLNEGDELWCSDDDTIKKMAMAEMSDMGFMQADDLISAVVIRQKKAYPAYFGTYDHLNEVRDYLDGFENLFLLGRNGQHRYNNQDHSMLTAMVAVDGIAKGDLNKDPVWSVNTEESYHEEKEASAKPTDNKAA